MKPPLHRNNVYLLRSLDPPDILSSRADLRGRAVLKLDPSDLCFVNERLEQSLPDPIFLTVSGRAAFLLPSLHPICGLFELVTLNIRAEKLLRSVKSGFFGRVVYPSRLDSLNLGIAASRYERDRISDAADHIRAMTGYRSVAEKVDADAESGRIVELVSAAAGFLGVELEIKPRVRTGQLENCDRDMISAFVLTALMFVRRAAKRRCGSMELSGDSRLWLTLTADCLSGMEADELEPLRQGALARDCCMRLMNEHGRVKVELCAYRTDVSLMGLKQDPELT